VNQIYYSEYIMKNIQLQGSDETKKWRISDKFINYDFVAFIDNTFPKSEGRKKVEFRTLVGFNSVSEWAYYFQLQEIFGITVDAILKLLDDKGCILELNRKENYLRYHRPNITRLWSEIHARIEK
jgi:hypothetical protein